VEDDPDILIGEMSPLPGRDARSQGTQEDSEEDDGDVVEGMYALGCSPLDQARIEMTGGPPTVLVARDQDLIGKVQTW
jgi:hypothetical protein